MYKVTKKFSYSGPETFIGNYKTLNEAKKFIQDKLLEDSTFKVNSIYLLYEGMDLIEELDQSKLEITSKPNDEESQGSGGAGKGSSQQFNPSPFSMTPRPKGMPQSWVKEEDKKDEDKK